MSSDKARSSVADEHKMLSDLRSAFFFSFPLTADLVVANNGPKTTQVPVFLGIGGVVCDASSFPGFVSPTKHSRFSYDSFSDILREESSISSLKWTHNT